MNVTHAQGRADGLREAARVLEADAASCDEIASLQADTAQIMGEAPVRPEHGEKAKACAFVLRAAAKKILASPPVGDVATVCRYRCATCGIVYADEDGCCATCGADAERVVIPKSEGPFSKPVGERCPSCAADAPDWSRPKGGSGLPFVRHYEGESFCDDAFHKPPVGEVVERRLEKCAACSTYGVTDRPGPWYCVAHLPGEVVDERALLEECRAVLGAIECWYPARAGDILARIDAALSTPPNEGGRCPKCGGSGWIQYEDDQEAARCTHPSHNPTDHPKEA